MRKKEAVKIDAEGRDKDKVFVITEMPAEQAEWWGIRAMGAMQRAGVDMPPEAVESGLIGMAGIGLKALMGAPPEELRPLLAEVMECVRIIVPAVPDGRPLVAEDIEEVSTRIRLRDEVFKLHVGFSIATALLAAVAVSIERRKEERESNLSDTQTPAPASDLSSQAG